MTGSDPASVPRLVEHFERHLGAIEVGWSKSADGVELPFQVVRFKGSIIPGCTAFATVGLSQQPLPSRRSDRDIRHEFVMLVPDRLREGPVPGLLQQVASQVLASESALLRGDVVGPRGPLFAMSRMEALYAAVPVYLPDDFASCEIEDGTDVAIVWLVPISRSEAEYVNGRGWDAFEERLVEVDPDLTDVDRDPLFQ